MVVSQARAAEGPQLTSPARTHTHTHERKRVRKHTRSHRLARNDKRQRTVSGGRQPVLVNDKLRPETTDPCAALLRDP